MTDYCIHRNTRADDRDRACFDADTQAELDYIRAERAGVRKDGRPLGHTLKVEQFSYSFGPTSAAYSLIRLKGRWLSAIFPPNTRVVI